MSTVFRVEKRQGYTIMSNHHLRNAELTLKAKGLLSQMLSLPENWDYTLKGLSRINKESIDAIRTAIWELERAGYITRKQGRAERFQTGKPFLIGSAAGNIFTAFHFIAHLLQPLYEFFKIGYLGNEGINGGFQFGLITCPLLFRVILDVTFAFVLSRLYNG